MTRILWTVVLLVSIGALMQASAATTIEQQLTIVTNDQVLNGNFQIAVQVKGTSLPAGKTLGSATIDVQFDNTKLSYVNGTLWAFSGSEGYNRSATNNTTYIRVGVTSFVNADDNVTLPGSPPGFDIGTSYVTWVQLNFKILDVNSSADLTIATAGNAIGLYNDEGNVPKTGNITDQPLSAPINITNAPLPIQLVSFTAGIIQQSGNVVLKWSTASETDNYGFYVQKSKDDTKSYQTIENSFVAGHGTTTEQHAYSFTDVNTSAGVWYYRLQQVDRNGALHYSDGIRADGLTGVESKPLPTVFAVDQNYPNPFNPSTMITYALPQNTHVSLIVYNMLGQAVQVLVNDDMEAGYHNVQFNGAGLASGIYFYRFTTQQKTDAKRMLLVK